jgi:hypothetical protein
LRGLLKVGQRYLMQVAGHNLGIIMRWAFGKGTPRGLQGLRAAAVAWILGRMGPWARSMLNVQQRPLDFERRSSTTQ